MYNEPKIYYFTTTEKKKDNKYTITTKDNRA